jgi:hypothetical protein
LADAVSAGEADGAAAVVLLSLLVELALGAGAGVAGFADSDIAGLSDAFGGVGLVCATAGAISSALSAVTVANVLIIGVPPSVAIFVTNSLGIVVRVVRQRRLGKPHTRKVVPRERQHETRPNLHAAQTKSGAPVFWSVLTVWWSVKSVC